MTCSDFGDFCSSPQEILMFALKEDTPSGPVAGELDILVLHGFGVVVKPFPDFLRRLSLIPRYLNEWHIL